MLAHLGNALVSIIPQGVRKRWKAKRATWTLAQSETALAAFSVVAVRRAKRYLRRAERLDLDPMSAPAGIIEKLRLARNLKAIA